MPKITFLPNPDICPQGATVQANVGESILEIALKNNIDIDHACEMSCACSTCHCIIREGFNSLTPSNDQEEDMLDKAWGVEPHSRLSCQARVTKQDLIVEIPRYTVNHAKEEH